MQVENDNVLLAYLPVTSTSSLDSNHEELRKTALALLEVLPEKRSAVGVVTSAQLAKQMHLHATQPVRFYTPNSTHVYPNKTLDSERLLVWTMENIPSSPSWLNLSGKKSLILKRVLEGGTGNTLLVFSPRPVLKSDKIYSLLRQVSTDYYNCDKSATADNLVTRLKEYNAAQALPGCKSSKHSSTISSSACGVSTSPVSCQLRRLSYEADNFPACSAHQPCLNSNSSACQVRVPTIYTQPVPFPHSCSESRNFSFVDCCFQDALKMRLRVSVLDLLEFQF